MKKNCGIGFNIMAYSRTERQGFVRKIIYEGDEFLRQFSY
jgi:hypothetical protein